jgi:hypothetical protein
MKRTLRCARLIALSLAAAALLAPAGCGSNDSAAPAAADLESRLSADTGVTWLVDRDQAGKPKFLTALSAPPPIATSVPRDQAVIAFMQRYADLLGGSDLARELVLVDDLADRQLAGVHHLRFAQRIPGSDVRVLGADTFVHLDAGGAVRFIATGLVKDIASISAHPVKSPEDARRAAEGTVRGRDPNAAFGSAPPPELVVRRAADATGALAWRVSLLARVDGALEAPEVLVDANDGSILVAHDTAQYIDKTITNASNVYAYHTDCGGPPRSKQSTITFDDDFQSPLAPLAPKTNRLARNGDALHSTLITDRYLAGDLGTMTFFTVPLVSSAPETAFDVSAVSSLNQGDGAGVSTHENLALTDAFFRSLGQLGWDGTGTLPITVAVHAWTINPKGPKGPLPPANVVDIDGLLRDVIYLGDGTLPNAPLGTPNCGKLPSGVALDIVAHEFTHGVAARTAKLDLEGEAGALNEAIAAAPSTRTIRETTTSSSARRHGWRAEALATFALRVRCRRRSTASSCRAPIRRGSR